MVCQLCSALVLGEGDGEQLHDRWHVAAEQLGEPATDPIPTNG